MSTDAAALFPVLESTDLDAMVDFLRDELGLRIEVLSPADAPAEITMRGAAGGVVVRRSPRDGGGHLLVDADRVPRAPGSLTAPNGAIVEIRAVPGLSVPPADPRWSIVRADEPAACGTGRAGMTYRDLLPGRWGGRFVASHITIPGGGDVADWVHHHRVRFQMIFCAAGWVEVVYEDQGDPFRLEAGDCVLQPPGIRHRVLRSSPGLEVIEVGCPAVHDTIADHDLALPTGSFDPGRDFGGQRFVRHRAAAATVREWSTAGWTVRDTGIAEATDGLASARVLRAGDDAAATSQLSHDGEIAFHVVLGGTAELHRDVADAWDRGHRSDGPGTLAVAPRDAIAVPPGGAWSWSAPSGDFELLEVTLPAGAVHPTAA